MVGKTLGSRWEITEFLGEGSMSAAYRARDLNSGAYVVIKMLHQHLVANNKNLKRFEQRAKSSLALMHHRIGRMIDVQLTMDGNVFLVVEELDGESLEDLLAKSGHLSADQALDIFIQTCEALEYAHEQDCLHRDIKPSNIILLEGRGLNQDVKLVDFGVAKLLSEEGDDVKSSGYITRTREVFGSPMYMSPEQCMGKKLDGRSDIYSLGCVMYETLTGKPPFVGKNVLETAYKHMNEAPKPIAADRPGDRAIARFESCIFKCLAKDPNERYLSVSQLRSDLETLAGATEGDWAANAYALRKITKGKRRELKKKAAATGGGSRWRFSFSLPPIEILSLVIVTIALVGIVAFMSISFFSNESSESQPFNNDMLWNFKDPRPPREIPDFGSREEAQKMDLSTIEKEKGVNCREYVVALWNLARLYEAAGHWADAAQTDSKIIETIKKVGGPMDIPTAYTRQALAYFRGDQYQDAEVAATNALEEAERAALNNTREVVIPYNILGNIYALKGELDKATDMYEKLYNLLEPRRVTAPSDFAIAASRLADVYRRQDKLDYAERYYKQALETSKALNPESVFVCKCEYGLGLVLEKEGSYKDAEEQFRAALPIARSKEGPRSALAGAVKKELMDTLWHSNWLSAMMFRFNDNPNAKQDPNADNGPPGGVAPLQPINPNNNYQPPGGSN